MILPDLTTKQINVLEEMIVVINKDLMKYASFPDGILSSNKAMAHNFKRFSEFATLVYTLYYHNLPPIEERLLFNDRKCLDDITKQEINDMILSSYAYITGSMYDDERTIFHIKSTTPKYMKNYTKILDKVILCNPCTDNLRIVREEEGVS